MRLLNLEDPAFELKNYVVPWEGNLLLACKRCQKKLRKSRHSAGFAKVKKWIKARGRKEKSAIELRVIEVPCLKICPKNGVVVCSQAQLAASPARFSIVRSEKQLESLYRSSCGQPGRPARPGQPAPPTTPKADLEN